MEVKVLPRTVSKYDYMFKILFLGESGVGKSALAGKAADDFFEPNFISTIGVDFKVMFVETPTGKVCKLQLWDSAGQERFRTITANYFRKADGVFIVFDMTDHGSLDRVTMWTEELAKQQIKAPCLLLSNKCDLPETSLVVSPEAANAMAKSLGMEVIMTSAKTGHGIFKALGWMVAKMIEARGAVQQPQSEDTNLINKQNPQPSGGCC